MRIRILNKFWNLRFAPNLANRGDCDAPTQSNKEIRVLTTLRGEERLEVLIHEMVHAAGWHIDESFVATFADDMARALWRLGYRHQPTSNEIAKTTKIEITGTPRGRKNVAI